MTEWREALPPEGESGPIYGFRRGYRVREAGRHESADQYSSFQHFLRLQGERNFKALEPLVNHSALTLGKWSERFNWQKRAAAWDKDQLAIVWREADRIARNTHKESVVEFRETAERQARMMSQCSEKLVGVLSRRIEQMEQNNEEIPMALISGLMRAATGINEQSRQSWASALGVNELLQIVESEVNKVEVRDVTEVDAYDIPIEE